MTNKISLIIITKDRPEDLLQCYESIKNLDEFPDEFILIDSSRDVRSKHITTKFARHVPFPVRYIYEPRKGFPIARNRGLVAAKYDWTIFTDDDCVVDPQFVAAAKNMIHNHSAAAAIAGESRSYYPHNLISHAATFNENHWKSRARRGNQIIDLETLDNKNVAYNLHFFRKNHISYDEKRTLFDGASDDCDLGMQIQQNQGKAYYANRMIVFHKDLTTLYTYTQRVIKRSSAHATYEKKWHSFRSERKIQPSNNMRFLHFFQKYAAANNLSLVEQVGLISLLVYTAILVRCIKKTQTLRLQLVHK